MFYAFLFGSGPDHWKDINHNCGGDHQSPINIEKAKVKRDSHLGDITFNGYDHAPSAEWKLMNDGHSGEVILLAY